MILDLYFWSFKMSITQAKIDRCIDLVKKYGGTKLILFGSALENPENANDLDLACDGINGWEFFELGAKLEELIEAPVDLIPMSPPTRFLNYIEKQGKVIYQS
jgi:predicted nucleotidyltransferase